MQLGTINFTYLFNDFKDIGLMREAIGRLDAMLASKVCCSELFDVLVIFFH